MISEKNGRILAVDWGAKRIGLAISDPTRTIASPLMEIHHISRSEDAKRVIDISREKGVNQIVIGVTFDDFHQLTPTGRSANRFAEEIQSNSDITVELWEEGESTIAAKKAALLMNLPRKKRRGHLDAMAAVIILQRYLEVKSHAEQIS